MFSQRFSPPHQNLFTTGCDARKHDVQQPATAGINGVVSLPPFLTPRSGLIYGSAALVAVALAGALLRPRDE